jgi:hypothetical protein
LRRFCTEDLIGPDGEVLVFGDCGSRAAAAVYFILFLLVVKFMLMNLFLAVVVENFSICFEPIEGLIEHEHVDHFLKVFAFFCFKEHRFSSLQEYLAYWNSPASNQGETVYGNPADLLHRSHLQKFLATLRVNPITGEQSGMTGYCNPLGGHLLGYHGRRHYLCVRAEIDNYIQEKMRLEAPWSARMMKAVAEKWRRFNKKCLVWWLRLTAKWQSNSSVISSEAARTLSDRRAFVIKRFRKAAALAYRQSTGQSFSTSRNGWQVSAVLLITNQLKRTFTFEYKPTENNFYF